MLDPNLIPSVMTISIHDINRLNIIFFFYGLVWRKIDLKIQNTTHKKSYQRPAGGRCAKRRYVDIS